MPGAASLTQRAVEAWPLANMWYYAQRVKQLPKDENLAFCYDVLNKVSRSFAVVVQQLPASLRDTVCVFYLVLRALDTIEDDMALPVEKKLPTLRSFHEKIYIRDWTFVCGTGEYLKLMQSYPRVTQVFLSLPEAHRKVIEEIARRMGAGMAETIERDVLTVEDYDLYCHYVAGLVGIGLTKLFAISGLEGPKFEAKEELSNHMGLFLQKTNIIRDYLEDIMEEPAPRMFWPKEIWGLYADKLSDFKDPRHATDAVKAMNHMITDALRHAPHCLDYMAKLTDRENFRFCAIPQIMAIATLGEIYNNPNVFKGVVKIRRGVSAQYVVGTNDQATLLRAFHKFSAAILAKSKTDASGDPNAGRTAAAAQVIMEKCRNGLQRLGQPLVAPPDWAALMLRLSLLAVVTSYVLLRTSSSIGAAVVHLFSTVPIVALAALLIYSSAQRV